MNCGCVDDIQKTMMGREFNDRKILKATFYDRVFSFGQNVDLVTCSRVEVVLENRKVPQMITVNHNYCPFCGVKIGKEKTETISEPLNGSDDVA